MFTVHFYSLCEPAQHKINLWPRSQPWSSLFRLQSVKIGCFSWAELWPNPFLLYHCPLSWATSTICRPGRWRGSENWSRPKIIPLLFSSSDEFLDLSHQAACKQLDHPGKGWCGGGNDRTGGLRSSGQLLHTDNFPADSFCQCSNGLFHQLRNFL